MSGQMADIFYVTNEQLQEAAVFFGQHFPERAAQVVEQAEYYRGGQFKLPFTMAADRWVSHGTPPDWLFNPTEDLEYIWLLNRHWHLRSLGIAYLLTGDKRYVRTFMEHIRSWIRQVPAPAGLSYEEAVYFQRPGPWRLLEVGLRAQSWIWGYMLVSGSAELERTFVEEFRESLAGQAAYLSRYLGDAKINHATMHMQGLFMVGTFLKEHRAAPYWRQLARERLLLCMEEQIRPDGIQDELAPHYHTGSLEMFGTPYWLAKRTGRDFPARYGAKLLSMVAFSLATLRPDGTAIPLSDSDSSRHVREKVGLIGAVTGDLGVASQGEIGEELLWLLGKEDYCRLLEAVQAEGGDADAAALPSIHFPGTGYYVQRDADNYVFFDAASLGGAHGHADALHVEWMYKGKLVFGDCGRYTYQEGEWRRYFKGTGAHNTVKVDGEDQTPYLATQAWGSPEAEVTVHRRTADKEFELIDASHNGYCRLPGSVTHRRWLLRGLCVPLLLIVDWLDGEGVHQVEQTFHLAEDAGVWLGEKGEGRALVQAGSEHIRFTWATAGVEDQGEGGGLGVRPGWRSADYGTKREIPVLAYMGSFNGHAVIATACVSEAAEPWEVIRIELLEEERAVKVHLSRTGDQAAAAVFYVEEVRAGFEIERGRANDNPTN